MKAVIVELNKDRAAVLSDDGCIVTVKNENYEIGQVIQMKNAKMSLAKKITALAASAAAFILLGTGAWAYASPYTYVSLDVNPSIEFTVNRFDRVIKVTAVNDDGKEILSEIPLGDLENETIENAIKATVDQLSEAGYFEGDTEGGIVIATSSEDTEKSDELAQELQDTAEQEAADNGDTVDVEAFSVAQERVAEARELGVTPGKLNLVEKLQEAAGEGADINTEDWLNKPVKDIMKATKDYRKASEDAVSDDQEETGEQNGETTAVTEQEQQNNNGKDTQIREQEEQKVQKDADKAVKEADKEDKKSDKNTAKEEEKTTEEDKPAKNAREENKPGKDSKKNDDAALEPDTKAGSSQADINGSGQEAAGDNQDTDKNGNNPSGKDDSGAKKNNDKSSNADEMTNSDNQSNADLNEDSNSNQSNNDNSSNQGKDGSDNQDNNNNGKGNDNSGGKNH